MTETSAIRSAAQQLASAELREREAAQVLAAARAKHNQLSERIDDLRSRRSAIVDSARQGNKNDQKQHALQLAVVDADLEDLAKMLDEAGEAVTAARGRHVDAQNVATMARQQFQIAEDEATEAALVEHANHLDKLLRSTMGDIAAIGQKLRRHRPAWLGSDELYADLRHLRLISGRG
ncbi:hypothetical protein [Azospirillum sp.]|uniref:hypothetical protein n=1 Tax=Azospirillum sp. TaxID=34012 RepID=UPI002D56466D|nr:hypothetical protein [Azospirillum sp.]HYD68506.1 hypothetical protein [Azospirillum sp.]